MTDKTDQPTLPEAFAALGIRPSVLRGLAEAKFTTPSDIQSLLIPKALQGVDILGQARTGTGKTAAFGIPILQRCERDKPTQAVILVPTRELAVQVEEEIRRLGQFTPIRSVAVYGGQKIAAQVKQLKHNPQILVGTPGRVMDLLDRRIINFQNVRFVVLDEVDRMLDIGFRDDIRNILGRVRGIRQRQEGLGDRRSEIRNQNDEWGAVNREDDKTRRDSEAASIRNPQSEIQNPGSHDSPLSTDHRESSDLIQNPQSEIRNPRSETDLPEILSVQTIFVSATISSEIEKLARTYMCEPVEKLIAEGSDEKPTVAEVEQFYLSVPMWDKYRMLRMLLERENPDLAIIFCRTRHGAQKLAKKLHADGIECREIHGDLIQSKRERVMKGFKGGKFDVLVATDLASRGIDVADISHIINYDIPDDPEVYVHRVGRTARMGAAGKAFTFVAPDEGEQLTRVESLINMMIAQATVEGFEPRPAPSDWTEAKPGAPGGPGGSGGPAAPARPAVAIPARTMSLGAKLPLSRRHRRRR